MLLARLSALDKELDRLPPVGMEMSRLMRDLKAYEQSFAFLTAQYEDARIEEATGFKCERCWKWTPTSPLCKRCGEAVANAVHVA